MPKRLRVRITDADILLAPNTWPRERSWDEPPTYSTHCPIARALARAWHRPLGDIVVGGNVATSRTPGVGSVELPPEAALWMAHYDAYVKGERLAVPAPITFEATRYA